MKRNLTLLLLFSLFQLSAQIPAGYYNSAVGKTGAALKTQLSSIISAGAVDKGYDYLYTIYKTSDNLPNGKVWDMYSIKSNGTANYYYDHGSDKCGSYSGEGSCYNREHTFCDSWLGNSSPQRSDAHHLIPTDGYVNNRRSSFPHGKVGSATWTSSNGSKLGSSDASTGYSGTVFEPIDEFKGDFARMYFYVATRYESKIAGWANNGSAGEILAGNSYPGYKAWFYNLMLKWNALDPVSQKERNRNDAIQVYQKNRNPYIDHPELADYVWGAKAGQPWAETSSTDPVLNTPISGSTIDFGNVPNNQVTTMTVDIKATNLTGDLTLSISGTNASQFSIPVSSVAKTNATAGYQLVITYSPASVGQSKAVLSISGGGIASATVNLIATATDSFLALSASNVTSSGFTANWTSSSNATGYLLDVYSYTITGTAATTLLEENFNAGLPSSWSSSGYQDNSLAGNVKLASSKQNGAITTPALDLSGTSNLLVRAKQYGSDAGAKLTVTIDGDTLAAFTTAAENQDFTAVISEKTATSKITFSAANGARLYIDYVKVATEGATYTMVPVNGYPRQIGNVLSYNVSGLSTDSTYYYTITPQGNSASVSEVITVHTLKLGAKVETQQQPDIKWRISENKLVLNELPANSTVMIFNAIGKMIKNITVEGNTEYVELPARGMYIVQVRQNSTSQSSKVIY